MSQGIVIIGAGPAGLAAAYELGKAGESAVVLEKDTVVGGLSRTVTYKGFRCDIGGHRFFTKSDYVDHLWHEVLGPEFLRRPRVSRIFSGGKFFFYPLQLGNVLGNLGVLRSLRVVGSWLLAKANPFRRDESFTDWVSKRFGRYLFRMFFKSYTEKIWGISCDKLSADWAAQRIRNLSAGKAILNALGLGKKKSVASLIDEFDYPALGPGQMYEAMADAAQRHGVPVKFGSQARRIEHRDGRVTAVLAGADSSALTRYDVTSACFSSMPLDELVLALDPPAPAPVREAARGLEYRSLITVNLLLNQADVVPDTWIYIHDDHVQAARMQVYKNWSPRMVPDPQQSVIGLEYFCTEGDARWATPDGELHRIALADLTAMKLIDPAKVFDGFVVRYARAYPVYQQGYSQRIKLIREYLATLKNLYPMGRYGQFRYNNMDHSILTAHYSVQAMHGQPADPWSVNVEEEYSEEKAEQKPAT